MRETRASAGPVDAVVTAVPFYGLRSYSGDEREIGRAATIEEYASELVDCSSSITWNGPASLLVELGDVYAHRSLLGAPWRFGDVRGGLRVAQRARLASQQPRACGVGPLASSDRLARPLGSEQALAGEPTGRA